MSIITNTLYVDSNNQSDLMLLETTEGSTPYVRIYAFTNGVAVTFTSDHSAKFVYYVNREASEIVEVAGVVAVGNNYVDFQFTAAKTAINGKFGCSFIVYNTGNSQAVVQSDGMIILKRNPALDGATTLDTTTVINWGLYTNLPPLPWMIGNDLINVECADSPYYVSVNEAAKTFLHNSDCDFVFVLPKATTANIGKGYGFINNKLNYTITLQCKDGDYIDDSPEGGCKFSVRGYSIPCSVMIRQITADKYITIWGDGAFDTDNAVIDFSSSSSSDSSTSS